MSFPAVTEESIRQMWLNFLRACKLGTVVEAEDTTVWQKRDKFIWVRVGSSNEYSAESIAWPVRVLKDGIA